MNVILKCWPELEPWLRFAVDTQLFDLSGDQTAAVSDPRVAAVINRLKSAEKGFPALIEGSLDYRSTGNAFWDLHLLADIGISVKAAGLEDLTESFLRTQRSDGTFLVQKETKPEYNCLSSIVLSSLAKMGYRDDGHVRRYIDMVLNMQRLDGGWHCAVSRSKGARLEHTESCPMANVNVLRLLGQYHEFQKDERFSGAIDLLLAHWARRGEKWRPYGYGVGSDYIKLKYPDVKYGLLKVLDVLALFPYAVRQNEFAEMLDAVVTHTADGRYTPESVSRAYGGFDFAQNKEPSAWITFLVSRIQKRAAEINT